MCVISSGPNPYAKRRRTALQAPYRCFARQKPGFGTVGNSCVHCVGSVRVYVPLCRNTQLSRVRLRSELLRASLLRTTRETLLARCLWRRSGAAKRGEIDTKRLEHVIRYIMSCKVMAKSASPTTSIRAIFQNGLEIVVRYAAVGRLVSGFAFVLINGSFPLGNV